MKVIKIGVFALVCLLTVKTLHFAFLTSPKIVPQPQADECGTIEFSNKIDSGDESKGKAIFINNCASCHAKNMKTALTGPALGGAFMRFNGDTAAFTSYLHDQEKYIKRKNDKRIKKLHKDYSYIKKPKFTALNQHDIKNLLLYLE